MAKVIRLIELILENYTSHRSLTVTYGDITRLSGPNGAGKSSIGGAPVWTLYGTDLSGKKWSPKPTTYEADVTRSALLLEVDGSQYKFERGLEGGDIVYRLNDVPTKAKEYEAAVSSLFDKDEFMASYYPAYFFGLHWSKQRELVLRNTTAPAKSEVLKHLPGPQADKLAELTKKHSLDDLTKIHSGKDGKKTKLEKAYIAAQSKTKTLQEQVDRLPLLNGGTPVDRERAEQDIATFDGMIDWKVASMSSADENNRKIIELRNSVTELLKQRDHMKERFGTLQKEPIADTCRVCRQPLQGESVEAAKADKARRIAEFKAEYDAIVAKRKEAEAQLAALQYIDVSETMAAVRKLQEDRQYLVDLLEEWDRRQQLAADVEKAKTDEAATLAELKETIFILDAIKAYRAKEAEMMAEKVQALFTTLSIRLFKYVKSSDEYEPDFSIQMNGKDYLQLSTGERMAAELELTEFFFNQSEMVTPLFFDNRESYTGKLATFGQTIIARAVEDDKNKLKIETEDTHNEQ